MNLPIAKTLHNLFVFGKYEYKDEVVQIFFSFVRNSKDYGKNALRTASFNQFVVPLPPRNCKASYRVLGLPERAIGVPGVVDVVLLLFPELLSCALVLFCAAAAAANCPALVLGNRELTPTAPWRALTPTTTSRHHQAPLMPPNIPHYPTRKFLPPTEIEMIQRRESSSGVPTLRDASGVATPCSAPVTGGVLSRYVCATDRTRRVQPPDARSPRNFHSLDGEER